MKIKLNPDQEIVNTIREGLKRTGTMTQSICKLKNKESQKINERSHSHD